MYLSHDFLLQILQEKGIEGWWQNEEYEQSSIAEGVEPVIEYAKKK